MSGGLTLVDIERARQRINTEFPRRVRWLIHGTPLDFDFSRSQHLLRPLSESDLHGIIEDGWAAIQIFGEQNYAEGGGAAPYLGIDIATGAVRGLDVEIPRVFLLNSEIDAFIETFRLFDRALRLRTAPLESVSSAARAVDPGAFEQSEWSKLLTSLLDEERG